MKPPMEEVLFIITDREAKVMFLLMMVCPWGVSQHALVQAVWDSSGVDRVCVWMGLCVDRGCGQGHY